MDSSERILSNLCDFGKVKFEVHTFIFKPPESSVLSGEAISVYLVWLQVWALRCGISLTAIFDLFGDGVQSQLL